MAEPGAPYPTTQPVWVAAPLEKDTDFTDWTDSFLRAGAISVQSVRSVSPRMTRSRTVQGGVPGARCFIP